MAGSVAIAENFAVTKMRIATATYMWTVQNFSYYSNQTGKKLYSPIFTVGDDADLRWRLDLFPMGYNNPNWVSLYLHLRRAYHHTITAQFRFSILNKRGQVAYQVPWSPKHKFSEGDVWGFEDFIHRKDLMKDSEFLLPGDKLTIYCEVKASMGYEIIKTEPTTLQPSNFKSEQEVCNDFKWLYKTGQFSDVTLLLSGMHFLAHKCILASRSSVFQQMFEEHTRIGNELHLIDLCEFETRVVMEVLRYVYTGEVENLHLLGVDLLAAAVRYDLQGLKLICEEYLMHILNHNNAWNLLVIADQRKATKLKLYTIKFITDHANDLINTPGYCTTQNCYPDLVTEVINAITGTKYVPPKKGKKRKFAEYNENEEEYYDAENCCNRNITDDVSITDDHNCLYDNDNDESIGDFPY